MVEFQQYCKDMKRSDGGPKDIDNYGSDDGFVGESVLRQGRKSPDVSHEKYMSFTVRAWREQALHAHHKALPTMLQQSM